MSEAGARQFHPKTRQRPVGVSLEKTNQIIGGVEHLSCKERLREFGVIQPEKEKASGCPNCSIPVPKWTERCRTLNTNL